MQAAHILGCIFMTCFLVFRGVADRVDNVTRVFLETVEAHTIRQKRREILEQEAGGCEAFCLQDTKNRDEHCNGALASLCGDCPHCDALPAGCEDWCIADSVENGKDRHCGGDMQGVCGACKYCSGYVHGKQEAGALGVLSLNVMSWCTQLICQGQRMQNIANAIKEYHPAILGIQGHEDDDVSPEEMLRNLEEEKTGLLHAGSGTFYDRLRVEPLDAVERAVIHPNGRFITAQTFRIRSSAEKFVFFNTEWGHDEQEEQAQAAITFMTAKSSGLPMVLTGNFNTWESTEGLELLKKALKLQQVSLGGDTACGHGTLDFIFASQGFWHKSGAVIDKTNCDTRCDAQLCATKRSDHSIVSVGLLLAP